MSSSSDSEDENLKLILEAVDTNLLSDALFINKKKSEEQFTVSDLPSSQRYLNVGEQIGTDFVPADAVQKHMSKKLSMLVQQHVEFVTNLELKDKLRKPKRKSKVKLLKDFECYVKSYEDFEYEEIGERKKPIIKRRIVDKDEQNEEEKLKSVAIDGSLILSGGETKNWTGSTNDKVFYYKFVKGTDNVHHSIEPENEFTKIRRKNKWHESKIKTTKLPKT